MLNMKEIERNYPEQIRGFKRGMLREYLQYKILQIIFDTPEGAKLSFLGGTALRLIHGNTRFSEDLDFDNFGLSADEFESIAAIVKEQLTLEGYEVETRTVFKGAYRCYVRLPKLLFDNALSPIEEEKILIQLDTLSHGFSYTPEKVILNKFEVFTEINVTPIDVLLAQKFYAIFNRKTKKGRDFFDVIFLLSKTRPNYLYLKQKLDVADADQLRARVLDVCSTLDFAALAKDVEAFLFSQKDVRRVELFKNYMETAEL
ncbi:MAG: nucleotidyl transferase AbiEii/AbiGii toxin family protein [Candidatus Moraniibacteriota bacterium]